MDGLQKRPDRGFVGDAEVGDPVKRGIVGFDEALSGFVVDYVAYIRSNYVKVDLQQKFYNRLVYG